MAAIASQGASRNLDVHQRYSSRPCLDHAHRTKFRAPVIPAPGGPLTGVEPKAVYFFDDIERAHKRNVGQLPANAVSDQFKKDSSQVKSTNFGPSSPRTEPQADQADSIRSKIAKEGGDTGDLVRDAERAFHSKAGVEVDKDGHIFTHRSLFGEANEQVRSDPDVVAEKAKELALRLAKMAKKEE